MVMTRWSIARAKAELSRVVEEAAQEPQELTNRGRGVAVVVSKEEWDALVSRSGRRARSPMEAFLDSTEELKAEGDLTFPLPRRRAGSARRDPFDE
jgi:prevent-host-death family protein